MTRHEVELVERLAALVAKLQMVNCGVLRANPPTQAMWRRELKDIRAALQGDKDES